MSVEKTNVVDAIGIEKNEWVVLTISDHLEWDLANEHLLVLQDKINGYLRFIESGEIFDAYPQAHGKQIMISIVALHSPFGDAVKFIDRAKETVEKAGFGFRFQQRDMNSETE
jgi:hypothetical protein